METTTTNSNTTRNEGVINQYSYQLCNNDVNHKTESLQVAPRVLSEVVELNVGGVFYTTSLTTLRKSPRSMLAVMFSGRHHFAVDKNGRCFIDRDGHLFQYIINFLRQGDLPPLNESLRVYHEAQFYNMVEMCEAMEFLKPVAGEKLRKEFLDHVPNYEHNLYMMLEKAQHIASLQPERISKLRVCVYKEDIPSTPYENNIPPLVPGEWNPWKYRLKHLCDVNMTFGPWKATPDVYDLIECIRHDLADKGYELEHQCIGVCDQQIVGQYYCKRPIFEFKFKWW